MDVRLYSARTPHLNNTITFISPLSAPFVRRSSLIPPAIQPRNRPFAGKRLRHGVLPVCCNAADNESSTSVNETEREGDVGNGGLGQQRSEKKDLGMNLLKEDFRRFTNFITQLFTDREKNPSRTSTVKTKFRLALFDFSPKSYQPLSNTGRSVAKRFSAVRGSWDRTVERVVIGVRTLLATTARATRRLTAEIDNGGWKLLAVFDPDKDEQNETRRIPGKKNANNIPLLSSPSSLLRVARNPIMLGGLALSAVGFGISTFPLATLVTVTTMTTTGWALISSTPAKRKGAIMGQRKSKVLRQMQMAEVQAQPIVVGPKPKLTKRKKRGVRKHSGEVTSTPVRPQPKPSIDTSAYAVSAPKPSLLATPVIGFILNSVDSLLFSFESISSRSLRRLGFVQKSSTDLSVNDGWCLLGSFDENDSRYR